MNRNTARKYKFYLLLIVGISLMQACSIKEDLGLCVIDECLVYVKVEDIVTGQDMTVTGEVEDVKLFIFDEMENFMASYGMNAELIAGRQPVALKDCGKTGFKISAWGNLGEKISISDMTNESILRESKVTLLRNKENNGYDISPEDFFSGIRRYYRETKRTAAKKL